MDGSIQAMKIIGAMWEVCILTISKPNVRVILYGYVGLLLGSG